MDKVVACQTCGLVQELDRVPWGCVVKCSRCDFQIFHRRVDSRSRALAFSLAAAILYFPSNLYPIVTAEYQGQAIQTTIFQGIKALWNKRQCFYPE
jgi:paraquat-inducible protein A